MPPDRDFLAQLAGFSLTTAEILYRLPDHPSLLQSFIWQDYDVHPRFPRLKSFLDFWSRNLDGKLYRVRWRTTGSSRRPSCAWSAASSACTERDAAVVRSLWTSAPRNLGAADAPPRLVAGRITAPPDTAASNARRGAGRSARCAPRARHLDRGRDGGAARSRRCSPERPCGPADQLLTPCAR